MIAAIEIDRASKSFRAPRHSSATPRLTVLDDVSLTVAPGDKLLLIGRNGAGKTSLLRLINRVYQPDSGSVTSHGRIVSILRLGLGLVGDLSVCDNVLLYGTLLGMRRRSLLEKRDSVIAAAGLNEATQRPLRSLSSGMIQRLAFEIASLVPADILLLDEILAVGDEIFQRDVMDRLARPTDESLTVVFATHNFERVPAEFTKAAWVENGRIAAIGPTQSIISAYRRSCGSSPATSASAMPRQ